MSPATADGASVMEKHPDLDNEVAALSNKLISAINHQTTLDDNLSSTRMELDRSQQKVQQLEALIAEQREMLAGDVWIKRKTAEAEKTKLLGTIALEKKLRQDAEQQRKKMELELESLTAALFEEANKMVITAKEEAREREEALQKKAKEEQDALQRKNDMLKAQLADTEGLLRSQSEQLSELKHVLEAVNTERDDQTAQSGPTSPGFSKFSRPEAKYGDLTPDSPSSTGPESAPLSPSYPTSFTHLLRPVLRTDLTSFNDFRDLIRTFKRFSGSRLPSGGSQTQSSSLAALGIGLGQAVPVAAAGNGSTSSLSTAGTPSAPQTPNTPASTVSVGSAGAIMNLPPLKDTKFYKRALVEDIEPTLRLDLAPGLSWLNRRNVLAAITEGSLVVEPIPSNTPVSRFRQKPQFDPCSLCGEARKEEEHLRTYRFRTSESGSANQYPLCKYCLSRLRSTCDYTSFLRIVKDGHWHAEDEDSEKVAWEESVRLREQMFWSRIGGGVVPATIAGVATSRTTAPTTPVTPAHPTNLDKQTVREQAVAEVLAVKENHDPATPAPDTDREDFATPLGEIAEPSSKTHQTPQMSETTPDENLREPDGVAQEIALSEAQEHKTPSEVTTPAKPEPERLSISIPGSFEMSA
jgi:hypothetical protein